MTLLFRKYEPICNGCNQYTTKGPQNYACSPYNTDGYPCPCSECIIRIVCSEGCQQYMEFGENLHNTIVRRNNISHITDGCYYGVDFSKSDDLFIPRRSYESPTYQDGLKITVVTFHIVSKRDCRQYTLYSYKTTENYIYGKFDTRELE